MEKYREKAVRLDKEDDLASFRDQFVNDEHLIYLDGNSLGKLPKRTSDSLNGVIQQQWGDRLIRSWNEHWMELPQRAAAKIAKLIGAREDEVFVGDSTSLNLYKLAYAALKANDGKTKVLSDNMNFPSDIYVMKGLIDKSFSSHQLELMESSDGVSIAKNTIQQHLSEDTALLSLSHVVFKSSFMYDMKWVNEQAKQNGTYVIWDLSHAAGAVPVQLNTSGADMAIGCTYKYLNAGPGAPAFLYVRKDLQEKMENPIWSWFSHNAPFDFDFEYEADAGIQKFAVGTPYVMSMAGIDSGADILLDAGIENLRQKSLAQSDLLIEMITAELSPFGFKMASPLSSEQRGSHVSIQHNEGYRINRALIEPADGSKVIIPDFRPPNNIRLGIAPLYNSFFEMYETVVRMKQIMETKEYERFGLEKLTVT